MTASALQKLREWLTVAEAADELSLALSDRVSPADVLRLAIDGHLKLSLYLPTKIAATCSPLGDGAISSRTHETIEGLCDVPMKGRGKLQIEHEYHSLRSGTSVPTARPIGALVEQGNLVCQLPPDRGESGMYPRSQSEFPQASVLAVRRATLEEFAAKHPANQARPKKDVAQKPLGERERGTYLVIIAALCKRLRIDTNARGAAGEIAALTEALGVSVTDDTVRKVLGQIIEALETRRA